MLRVALCDSDAGFVNEFCDRIQKFYEERGFEIEIRSYSSGEEFTECAKEPIDLIFMNTQMPDMSGYALMDMLQERKSKALLVFLSDHDEDVFEAFRYRPLRYMRKKVWREELTEVLEALWREEHIGRCIRLITYRKEKIIRLEDLVFLESRGHYVYLYTTKGESFHVREKLSFYSELLRGRYFIQPSKSFLVNCAYIETFGLTVQLRTGEQFNCTKSRRNEAELLYQKYLEEIVPYL